MTNRIDVNKKNRNSTQNSFTVPLETVTVLQPRSYSPYSPIRSVIIWIKQASLRTKATAFAVAISTLPILGIGAFTYYLVNQSLTKEISKIKQASAIDLSHNIQQFILARTGEVQLFASQSFLTNPKQRNITSFIEQKARINNWQEIYQFYESIAILKLNGEVFLQTQGQSIPNQKNQEYFQAILKTNQPYVSQPFTTINTEQSKILLAVPVKDSVTDKTIYIIQAVISVQSLAQTLNKLPGIRDEYHLIDETGKIFLAKNKSDVGKDAQKVIPSWEQLQNANQILTRILPDKKGHAEDLTTYVPWQTTEGLPDLNWSLVLSTDKAIALATQRQILLILTIGIVVTAVLVGAIAAILATRLTLPIQNATMVVKKLARGNFDTRITVRGEDEFATLGASINRMADQLQDLLNKQKAEAERLKLFTNISATIRQSLNCEDLFNITVTEARQALGAHRVVVYHFNAHGRGQVVAESVAPSLPVTLGDTIEDGSIARQLMEAYSIGGVLVANNIFEMDFAPEYLKLMEQLEVKAILATPILKDNQIFGFLMAHYCWAPHVWQPFEINFLRQLAVQVGLALERVSLLEVSQALKDFAIYLSGNLNSQEIYSLAVQGIRKALKVDRVVICQFDEKSQGNILAESGVDGLPCAVDTKLSGLQDYIDKYRQGDVLVTNNIYQAGFAESYIKQLESLAVKAHLEAPILSGGNVLGLLIAHQCTRTRVWQQAEIDLFEQFTRLVGLALERANLLEQSEKASVLQRQQTEQLQQQLLKLIDNLAGAKKGDLTVRVEVTKGEVGAIADFCNSMVENLQDVAIQVKAAASQLNGTVAENSGAIAQLAIDAFKQQQEISRTLDVVDQIRLSMKGVAKNARLATAVARAASPTAEIGDTAMDLTVENILSLREAMGETAKKLKRLGEYSQNISRLTSSIHKIALQTNLLAINAGIEAARVGGDNQGFASFSEEVAALAVESAGVTGEIEGIAANIQLEVSEVVKAMELGSAQVMEVTRLVEDSKHSLNQMLDVCRQIDDLVQSISTATGLQVHNSKEVMNFIKEIAKVSELTSSSSRKIFTSLQKTVEIYQQLQATVRNFKVS
ncbi:GAF domain-containing protein [Chlorogloeopsis sp. ULAP02]|uniref:GAF domain-containing protein n=1 Tax=Chlorogloeopsis sp. ULAP02 TaxID=3107926 RepID=UPI0031371596